jgi:hypothetical protein
MLSLFPVPNNTFGPFGENKYSQARYRERNSTIFSVKRLANIHRQ